MIDVWLHDKLNIFRQRNLNAYTRLSYGRKANDVGELEIVLPRLAVRPTLFTEDSVITVEESGKLAFDTIWLVYHVQVTEAFITVKAHDAMHFLARRFVLFREGDPQALKFQALDNMAKEVVRENLTDPADINRDFAGLTTAANLGSGPGAQLAFDGANVLKTLQEIANLCLERGTYLTFDFVMSTASTGVFTTWTNQRGVDRRTGAQTKYFGPAYSNIVNAQLELDYSNRASKITAYGAGDSAIQAMQTAQDATPLYETRWGVIEDVVQATNIEDSAYLLSHARQELGKRGTKVRFSGEFQETGATRFGRDIGYGDIIPVEAFGYNVACRVIAVVTTIEAPQITRSIVLEQV
jgi:hypothetical protein